METLTVDAAAAVARAGARSLVASRGGRLETALASAGGELIRMPVDSRNPLTLIANARRLRRVIRDERVSLVHVRSRAPAFSAVWAARVTGIPVVATYHGIYAARSPLKRWYNGVMTRGDAVIANSIFTRDHVLAQHRIAPSKIVVIAEGIDSTRFDPAMVGRKRVEAVRAAWGIAPDESRRVVLVVARLTGWKGHSVLIEALARSTVREETVLICVGRGETKPLPKGATVERRVKRGRPGRHTANGNCADGADKVRIGAEFPRQVAGHFGIRNVARAGQLEDSVGPFGNQALDGGNDDRHRGGRQRQVMKGSYRCAGFQRGYPLS